MESILIWFASGFSFVCGLAFGFFCFTRRPTATDLATKKLMEDRNALDAEKIVFLNRIACALEAKL